MQHKK